MRRKQSISRKRSGRGRRRASTQSRKPRAKKRSSGLWVLLIAILLAMGGWELTRVPPGQLVLGSMVALLVVLLLLGAWLAFRLRPTAEELDQRHEQQREHVQMQDTAQAFGVRPVELGDLEHLNDREFEGFVSALLEAAGIASNLERVGGAGDRGIDLRGKDRYELPFVVQCKRYFGHPVVPKETRDFGWAMSLHDANEAWFVTTSSFTDQAKRDVERLTSKGLMILVDGKKLVTFIRDHWDALPNHWQWRLTECMAIRDRRRGAK